LPPRVDLELEALAEVLDGKRLIHCHSYRQDEILAFLRVCEDFHVRVATLQHILEGYKVADVIAKHGAGGSSFSDWWAYKFEVWDAIPYNGAILHDAGVLTSFNSDDAELARRLNTEAAKAVKYGGVAPAEALKFVTLNSAKQLGIDRRVGSIEVGKDADLAVWSRSPLSSFTRCEQTWIDGRKYFDRTDDAKRRDDVAARRTALIQRILSSGESSSGTDDDSKKPMWDREDVYCGCRSPHVRYGQPYQGE
jgi:N-acetylglucosamine-6-phosphate deacetylase